MSRLTTSAAAWGLVLALWACGGAVQNGASDPVTEAEPGCVEARFGMAPRDQGLTPPGTRLAPGSVPEADCSEGPDR